VDGNVRLNPYLAGNFAPVRSEDDFDLPVTGEIPAGLQGALFRIGGGYYYGPGQTEDQLQPEANDRIGTTITSGPLLQYPLNTAAVVANYNINSPTLGYQPRAYSPGYRVPERVLSY